MTLLTNRARAWVYSGEWVADCPAGCNNVEFLFDLQDPANPNSPRTRRKSTFWCSYCKHVSDIDWARDEADLMGVLQRRPIPHTRNWYPQDHPLAVRTGLPHGQSAAQLLDENREHGVN